MRVRVPEKGERAALGLLSLVLATVALVATPTAAQAGVSAPTSLSPNGTGQSDVPALAWSPTSGATRYEVQVSSSPTFDSVLVNTSTENSRYVPTVQLPATTVFWRVRSVSATGTVSRWASASLGHNQRSGPTLQAPADGVVLEQPADPPVLSWSPIANASSYEVSIDNDPDFVDAKLASTRTTSYLVPDPQPATTFWWRVRAVRGPGLHTMWSSARSYRIGGLPEVLPTLPVEQEKVSDIVFDWPAVPGARDYELRVSEDRDFNTFVPGTPLAVKGTRYSPPVTYDNDEYYWQVRARDNAGNSIPWTDSRVSVRHFQRHWDGAPEQVYPEDSVSTPVGDPFFLEWTPVDHASRYELQLSDNQNFSPDTYKTCYTRATTYTPGNHGPESTLGCTPEPGKVYYWRVRGLDEPRNVQGLWSMTRAFVYGPAVVMPQAPANGATVDIPTLSWHASRDAERYHVEVRNSTSDLVASTDTYSLSWTPPRKLTASQGPFRWDVTSIDANGHRSASLMVEDQWTFSLSSSIPPVSAEPLAPLGGTPVTARFPALRWEPLEGAAYYKLHIGVAGALTLAPVNGTFVYPAMSDTGKGYLGTGSYDWVVEAYDSTNKYLGRSPSRGTFTIRDLPPVTGQQVALTGSSMDTNACDNELDAASGPQVCTDLRQTPVLDWDPSPEASHYLVYLSHDRELTNSVYSSPYITTQNTRWTPLELLKDSQAGDAYFWYVRPCKAVHVCAPDPTATADSATHAFDKASAPIELTSPADGTTLANEVTLEWQDNLAHVTAYPQVIKSGGTVATAATVDAKQYRVQISDDPTFNHLLVHEYVDQTTYTPYARTLPEGPLYWRVQAIDGSGNSLTWSEVRTIDKRSPRVTLRAPADDGVVDGTPFFRWAPQDFASGYRLEAYKNNDSTLSPANRVLSVTTKQAAYTPDQPLPVSSTPYLWRVQRLDADNQSGQWSVADAFKTTGQAPNPVSPVASGYVDSKHSYFSWEPVPGATTYQFERRADGSAYNSETIRTHALSWAPQTTIPDGRWEWRVSSIDSLGRVMDPSSWRDASVNSVRPGVRYRSPSKSRVMRDANFSVKFSEPVQRVSSTTMRLYQSGRASPLSARITKSNGGRTWTLNPSRRLARGKRFTCKLSSRIADRAGNRLRATSWTVSTR